MIAACNYVSFEQTAGAVGCSEIPYDYNREIKSKERKEKKKMESSSLPHSFTVASTKQMPNRFHFLFRGILRLRDARDKNK